MAESPRLPNNKQRLAITGRTGTGKTIALLYHLSRRNLGESPWLIYNFKSDEHINALVDVGAHAVDTSFRIGKKDRGIYIVNALPTEAENARVEKQMWHVWQHENCGVAVDEGYMIDPSNDAYNALLTQGRSKHIPMITLSQRPVWMPRFVFSEADFYQLFDLNDKRDWKTINNFVAGIGAPNVPEYFSYYFDVGKKRLYLFKPVPPEETLLETIEQKLAKRVHYV